mgnify:CR=1 FL=1
MQTAHVAGAPSLRRRGLSAVSTSVGRAASCSSLAPLRVCTEWEPQGGVGDTFMECAGHEDRRVLTERPTLHRHTHATVPGS